MITQVEILADPIQVAFKRIGVSHDMGYRLIREGRLRTFKIGKRRLASRAAQAEFIAQQESAAVPGKAA